MTSCSNWCKIFKMCITIWLTLSFIGLRFKSSHAEVLCKKSVLKSFAKFTEKHLYQSLFFDKVAGLSPTTLLKKTLWHRSFPLNFAKNFNNTFFLWNTSGSCFWRLRVKCRSIYFSKDFVDIFTSILACN